MTSLLIRRERSDDAEAVRSVHAAAFAGDGGREPVEVALVDALRACDGWLAQLSLVAESDGVVVGHSVCSRGRIEPARAPEGPAIACVGLGPIGVLPEHQGSGIGSALMWASIGAADALDEPLVALLGSPDYYQRFGFMASSELGIEAPDPSWGGFFHVLPLTSWEPSMAGRFAYAAPFDDLD